MTRTDLCFVVSDHMTDVEAACAAAGCDGAGARRFAALYAGLSRSERRVARAVGTRLWLPVLLEPLLTGACFGLDDEPPEALGPGGASALASAFPAGAAALEIALRHPGARVALVLKAEHVERIARELAAMPLEWTLPSLVNAHPAVRKLALELPSSAPDRDVALRSFLLERGADRVEHPGGTLLDHLQRTARTLVRWQARPALVAAGSCHAMYGTAGFDRALLGLDARPALAQLIGAEAEAIVYAYGAHDRAAGQPSRAHPSLRDRFTGQHLPLGATLLRDVAELSCANELDLLQHADGLDQAGRAAIAALLASWGPLLGQRAAAALTDAGTRGATRSAR